MAHAPDAQPHRAGHHHPDPAGSHVPGDVLELDAQVLAEVNADIVRSLPVAAPPRSIVDLGCGTGAGTFALLDRFPDARVTAVDAEVEHLRRVRDKACAAGLEAWVSTVQADLDDLRWPDLGTPDLIWASASLHHMADPDRVLGRVHELLAPGGLLVVVELAGFPRFLPEGAPEDRPGLEERCHAAVEHQHAELMPHRGADWGPKLVAAGLDVVARREIAVDVDGASAPGVGAYALAGLQRLRTRVADLLAPEDLAALDRLLDPSGPHGLLSRGDLAVRTERTVWVARRGTRGPVTGGGTTTARPGSDPAP